MSMNVTTINRAVMLIIENNAIASILSILDILETCMLQYCPDSSKKGISKLLKTTIMFHFYRFMAKYLNNLFRIKFLTFLKFLQNWCNIPETVRFQT